MLSRHAIIEDLANSLAQRRREVLRERARVSAYRGLARAVVFQQTLPESESSTVQCVALGGPLAAPDAA